MTTVRYDLNPDLKRPILIEGLPGIGNVGKIAADFLCEKIGAEKFATIYSESFPPAVMLDNDCVVHMACNELWYAKDVNGKDIIFLRGQYLHQCRGPRCRAGQGVRKLSRCGDGRRYRPKHS